MGMALQIASGLALRCLADWNCVAWQVRTVKHSTEEQRANRHSTARHTAPRRTAPSQMPTIPGEDSVTRHPRHPLRYTPCSSTSPHPAPSRFASSDSPPPRLAHAAPHIPPPDCNARGCATPPHPEPHMRLHTPHAAPRALSCRRAQARPSASPGAPATPATHSSSASELSPNKRAAVLAGVLGGAAGSTAATSYACNASTRSQVPEGPPMRQHSGIAYLREPRGDWRGSDTACV